MDLANASICLLYRYFICSSSVVLYFSLRCRYLFSLRVSFILLQVAVISVTKIWFLFIMIIHHKMVKALLLVRDYTGVHKVILVHLIRYNTACLFHPQHCELQICIPLGRCQLGNSLCGILLVGQYLEYRYWLRMNLVFFSWLYMVRG